MPNGVLQYPVSIVGAALLGAITFDSVVAQTVSTDTTIGTVTREDIALQSDLQRLERIEKVQAELQSEIAAIRGRIAARTGEKTPESRTPSPPAEPPSKSSVEDSKVTRLPELAPMEEEHWRFFVGGELLYVQPRWSTNPAYAVRTDITSTPFIDTVSQKNFDHDFNASPVITAGIVSPSGLGVRGRYWSLDSDAGARAATTMGGEQTVVTAYPLGIGIQALPTQDSQILTFRNSLRVQTADAELTWTHLIGPATFLFSGGARYANVRQGYDIDDLFLTTFMTVEPLRSAHRFEGAGPTLSTDVTYPLSWGGFSLYADGRGSIIFGDDREWATFVPAPSLFYHRELSQAVAMSNAELEAGVGWSHSFNRFGVDLRAGVVGQMWFNAGNGANNENILFGPMAFPSDRDQSLDSGANLGLIGFEFAAGVHF